MPLLLLISLEPVYGQNSFIGSENASVCHASVLLMVQLM